MAEAGGPILVIGAAKAEHIARYLARPEAAGATLLAPDRDRERFSGRRPATRFFSGPLRWTNPGLLAAFLAVRPRQVVIVCGLAYDHANVLEAADMASRLAGRPASLRIVVGDAVRDAPAGQERRPVWRELLRVGLLGLLAGVLWLLRPLVTIRVGRIYAQRIGHIALDCEIYLCERDLGACPPRTWDVFYPKAGDVANEPLLAMFARCMPIHPLAAWLGEAVNHFGLNSRHEAVMTTHQVAFVRDVRCVMRQAPVHLRFTEAEHRQGEAGLRRCGLPQGRPHVCLFGRDSRYLEQVAGSLGDGEMQEPRNMDIKTFRDTALALAELGYGVIRMGSVVKEPLGVDHPLVFDYATSDMRDPFLDIYFAATCRFFVGVPSGLIHVPYIFRVPCLYVNLVRLEFMPLCESYDISLFKRFRRKATGRFLSVDEVLDSGLGRAPIETIARDDSLELVDNTSEEILEAALEMHHRLTGDFVDAPVSLARQQTFRDRIPRSPYNEAAPAVRVGTAFLDRHWAELFPGEGAR